MKILAQTLAAAALLAGTTMAQATVVSLNFEGVNATYPSGYAQILNFYNGGLSNDGTTGTNYGVGNGCKRQILPEPVI